MHISLLIHIAESISTVVALQSPHGRACPFLEKRRWLGVQSSPVPEGHKIRGSETTQQEDRKYDPYTLKLSTESSQRFTRHRISRRWEENPSSRLRHWRVVRWKSPKYPDRQLKSLLLL